ncbi:MAG: SCO family protein [Verrucomicrobia bacterium]|jgi:cytochrome oxidase Cu insertion factor (SCO1/SenC/PrrC family)|nr:SCO family protein [Verrucomicrobiota bacterium]
MDDVSQKLSRTIWIGIGLLIVILCVSYILSRIEPRHATGASPRVLGRVADFTLTNQAGVAVTLADLRGRVWVADIIFTSCNGPCPRMTRQMRLIQDELPATSGAKLVTLTTDPDHDTPAVLKTYGERYGANPDRWMFLTGGKKEIAGLAIDSLKLTVIQKKPAERENPEASFIHSTIFVVVDKQARLRGVFETTGEGVDSALVRSEILATVQRLERER